MLSAPTHDTAPATPAPPPPLLVRAIDRAARIGADPSDTPDVRIAKGALALSSLSITILATAYVLMYLALGRPLSAAIPFTYQVASLASLAWFARTKRFDTFRRTQVALIMILPFLLQWSLGGFENGSAAMLWAFIGPVGALVFGGIRPAIATFAAFCALTLLSGLMDPWLAAGATPVPEAARLAMFVVDVLGVGFVVFLVLVYFVRERERAEAALDLAHRDLQVEQDRSERLIANMLPASVAARLKSGERVADAYASATVLFIDLVDSTPMAGRLAPSELVHLLDHVFTALDALGREHGLTKLKTGGDSWMAVAGVPDLQEDHAARAAEVALRAGAVVAEAASHLGETVRVRIGMHSGPLVAGVVGADTYAFDVWGQTVAIASRMESQGLAERIQCSLATAQLLAGRYRTRMRGTIEVKGVGEMASYWLEGRAGPDATG
ncbi:MAG: adenylate/guanylate cyclase domain-containing protein [Chloroflexota bacterium]